MVLNCKIFYQGFIEEPNRTWTKEELPPVSKGFTIEQIKERILNLQKVMHGVVYILSA